MNFKTKQNVLGKLLVILVLSSPIPAVQAAEWIANIGVDFGGDRLTTAVFTNGDTEDINAGELFSASIGMVFENTDNLETQFTFGIKADFITASNGDIDWTRFPLELLQFYKTDRWRLGAGLTYHLSPDLSGSGVASGVDASFDDALGVVVEMDRFFGDNAYFGVRYTSIDYEVGAYTFDGSSVGMLLGTRF